jgi:ATP-binding cassette subfamily C (CFTR/MRP) protein 1
MALKSPAYRIGSPPVLKRVSLVIEPSTKIEICGRSGRLVVAASLLTLQEPRANYSPTLASGKSSSILSLLRMLPIVEGSILLDDVDICQISSFVVRSAFNVVPQTPLLFPGSIRTNLDPTGIHSDSSITSILQKLNLWDIVASRGGLDADIDATPFGQGQKQLLYIARSLLSNGDRKILLFDESTSSLDKEMEQMVMQLVEAEYKGLTVVAVAHRLDTIIGFDKVMVLEGGELVEHGSPQQLLEIEGGSFRALWEYMKGRS